MLVLPLVMLASLSVGFAQNYSMHWFNIGGGGGTVSGSAYTLSGTVGQPDTGNLSGGSFGLRGGFWSSVEVPGAPQLGIARTNAQITVSWPLSATGYKLEQTPTPSSLSNSWAAISPPYSSNATTFYFRIASPSKQMFFRLHKP